MFHRCVIERIPRSRLRTQMPSQPIAFVNSKEKNDGEIKSDGGKGKSSLVARSVTVAAPSSAAPAESQEVGSGDRGRDHTLGIWHRVEEDWRPVVDRREFENAGDVAAAVAVVRGRPHRHQFLVKHVPEPW